MHLCHGSWFMVALGLSSGFRLCSIQSFMRIQSTQTRSVHKELANIADTVLRGPYDIATITSVLGRSYSMQTKLHIGAGDKLCAARNQQVSPTDTALTEIVHHLSGIPLTLGVLQNVRLVRFASEK